MPKKKEVKYKVQQAQIINKLLVILDANIKKTFILYEVEHNKEKLNKISELTTDIKKYFSLYNISGLKEPHKYKRPWLSIIRQILKKKYRVISGDITINDGDKKIRTRIYTLIDK